MQKCVKITLVGVDQPVVEVLYKQVKKPSLILELEGVARPSNNELEIVLRGPKDIVDEFVGVVDEEVIKYVAQHHVPINMFVEPCRDEEDYRGVFRFLRT